MAVNTHTLTLAWSPRSGRYQVGGQIRLPQYWRHPMRILAAEHAASNATLTLARWHWWDGLLRYSRRYRGGAGRCSAVVNSYGSAGSITGQKSVTPSANSTR